MLAFSRAGDGSLALKAGSPCVATLGGPPPAACTDARAMASPQDLASRAIRCTSRRPAHRAASRRSRSVRTGRSTGETPAPSACSSPIGQLHRRAWAARRQLARRPGGTSCTSDGTRARIVTVGRDPGCGLMQGATTAPACPARRHRVRHRRGTRGERHRHRSRQRRPGVRRGPQATNPEGVVTAERSRRHLRSLRGRARAPASPAAWPTPVAGQCTAERGLADRARS